MVDFFIFWWDCIIRAWSTAHWVFAFFATVSGIFAAALLVHKKRASKMPKDWRDTVMKWAWLCLLWSFAVSVIVISPYLEFHERDSKLRLLEEQGPHLYFDSLKLEDQGRLTTNEFHLTCVIRNRSDKPAQDCEMLFILIKKRDDGTFNLIPFAKSASGLIQPQGWLSASIIVGTELSTDSTRLSTNSPELPSDDLVIMEACKYLNPITRSQYTTPPFFNKFKIIQSSRTLDDLGALTIEESKRYFGAISNKYEEFRNPKPASSK